MLNIIGVPTKAGGQVSGKCHYVSINVQDTRFTTNPPHCPLTGTAPASMCSRIVDVVHPTPGAKVVMQSYFLLVVMLELTVEQSTPQPIV